MNASIENNMMQALTLAKRGEGSTSPNPPVGAVVVKNGKIIGEGYHSKAGGPHAEVKALKKAGCKSRGAELYVTLEPCSTTGKTLPCTDLILESGISKVYTSARDPNPKHRGRGCRLLKKSGVKVVENVCKEQGEELIAAFKKWITQEQPYMTLKMGMTFDGKIADSRGQSRWITGPESRRRVTRLRARSDAVLIGSETAVLDNPSLMSGGNSNRRLRIIVDSEGRIPLSSNVLTDKYREQTVIAVKNTCSRSRISRLISTGATVWALPSKSGSVSLTSLMNKLGKEGVLRVLCEGGGKLAGSLVSEGIVDEYYFFIAPFIMGSENARQVISCKSWKLQDMPRLKIVEHLTSGKDVLLRAEPARRK